METLVTWFAVTVAGLLVSAHTRVNLPVLGPTPVLGVVAPIVAPLIVPPVIATTPPPEQPTPESTI